MKKIEYCIKKIKCYMKKKQFHMQNRVISLMALSLSILLFCTAVIPAFAADGKVTYDGNAWEFIFEPGSDYSPTDLFPDFKDVMPGDSLTQKITVRNDASNKVKVKIYIRSLGAHEDSKEFLSQLNLRVEKSDANEMAYMFDATADQTAQLTDWVCLGTLYSGGEVNLDVILDVPAELDNKYSNQIGYLDWEFMVEEFSVEDSDPKPPQTGEGSDMLIWTIGLSASGILLLILILWYIREKRNKEESRINKDTEIDETKQY